MQNTIETEVAITRNNPRKSPSPKAPRPINRTNGIPEPQLLITLPELNIQTIRVRVVGDSSLVCNRWSEKAKQMMRDKQQKRPTGARAARDPEADYKASLYPHPEGGYGFPSVAFKSAAVSACSHVDGITKVEARGAFHINGEFVKIEGDPVMREDMVRVGMGVADLRYRGEFKTWAANMLIRFNTNVLSADQIVNLLNTAGFSTGVGEHRPSKNGSWGLFHVEQGS